MGLRWGTACLSLLFLVFQSIFAFAEEDPLFSKMAGDWTGEGARSFPGHLGTIQIDARVHTHFDLLEGREVLVSTNQITETSSDDPSFQPRSYTREYWVRRVLAPAPAGVLVLAPISYELGAQGSTQASSRGSLREDGVFEVEQVLGGDPVYKMNSQSRFDSNRVIYSDIFYIGSKAQSQSQIEYRRDGSN